MATSFDLAEALNRQLPTDSETRADVQQVLQHGYVILPDLFSRSELVTASAELDRLAGEDPKSGRNPFEGLNTVRIYSLLNKSRAFDCLCSHPRVLALNEYFLEPGFQLSTFHSISIAPGEAPQLLHYDDSWVNLARPRKPMGSAIMVPLDDSFTAAGGATRVVPGSHTRGTSHPGETETVAAECPQGGAVYFISTTWHGGGGNRSERPRESVTVQYCQPYMRQIENHYLAIDPRRLSDMPERVLNLLGYKVHPPFIGYVDGHNPLRGAKRMVEWLQEPLDPAPPAFMETPTSKSRGSKL